MKLTPYLAVAALMSLASTSFAQTITPLSLTGYNADVIVGVGETAPGYDVDFGHGAQYHLFENGLDTSDPTFGLPTSRTFVSSTNSAVEFQFAPYDGNNVANPTDPNSSSITLTLNNPGEFTALSFLTATNGAGGFTFTLNFSTGPSVTSGGFNPDIYSGVPGVLANVGSQTNSGFYTGPASLYEEDVTLAPSDTSRTLESITFTGSNNTFLFAVSGEAVPEPSTYAMMLAGLVALGFCVRRKLA